MDSATTNHDQMLPRTDNNETDINVSSFHQQHTTDLLRCVPISLGPENMPTNMRTLIQKLCEQIYMQNVIIAQQSVLLRHNIRFPRPPNSDRNSGTEAASELPLQSSLGSFTQLHDKTSQNSDGCGHPTFSPADESRAINNPQCVFNYSAISPFKDDRGLLPEDNGELSSQNEINSIPDECYIGAFIAISPTCLPDKDSPTKCEVHKIRHRTRTKLTKSEVVLLKSIYENTPSPSKRQFEELANSTGLPTKVLKVWFQNTRRLRRNTCPRCKRVFVTNHLFVNHSKQCHNNNNCKHPKINSSPELEN
ncbi:zinc finger homeobox protein 4-like isoform X2 [Symsagittifera roscoffensis]|uniref:zinc finger homeobox protein 4-like isoform X2 n=1 Tax=Symsagittifera roscoffensis TaxID=84072 RepID=UPI00307BBEDE